MVENRELSEAQANRVLDRAAEIEAVGTPDSVSVDDIRAAASEAGFSAAVIDQAIAETLRQSGTQEESLVVERGWGVSRFRVSLTVNVTLTAGDVRQVAALSSAYFEQDPGVRIDSS